MRLRSVLHFGLVALSMLRHHQTFWVLYGYALCFDNPDLTGLGSLDIS